MLFLAVPYAEKDQARQLGARWDAESKKWYVPKGALATPFERWLPAGDAADKILGKVASEAKQLAAGLVSRIPKASVRKLSMSDGAVRSREKKADARAIKAAGAAIDRPDASGGRITIGVHYVEQVGAVGLPWKL